MSVDSSISKRADTTLTSRTAVPLAVPALMQIARLGAFFCTHGNNCFVRERRTTPVSVPKSINDNPLSFAAKRRRARTQVCPPAPPTDLPIFLSVPPLTGSAGVDELWCDGKREGDLHIRNPSSIRRAEWMKAFSPTLLLQQNDE